MSLADELDADTSPGPRKRSLADDLMSDAPMSSAAQMQAPDPTGSTYDNVAAGAGKAVVDMGRGAAQILRYGLEKVGKKGVADRMGLTATQDVDEAKKRDSALMNTGAGQLGYVGGNIAATMLPLAGMARIGVPAAGALLNPATYTAAAASGALSGALQPIGTGDNRGRNMLIGAGTGLAGNAAVNAVGRIAQPIQTAADPIRQRAVDVLRNAGVPLDTAQISGSPFLNRLRSSFSDNPVTAGSQANQIAGQRAAFNNAVLGTIGEQGHAATQDVMRRADDRIGGVFHDVLSRNNVQVTDPLLTRIGSIQQAANDEERHAVSNVANRFIASVDENGAVPGQVAYGVKKDLDRLASSADSTTAYHARQMRSVIMDGINDSLPAADREAFAEARSQFRNMKTIEGAIDKEGSGNISPSMLANALGQKRNRAASIYGRGDQDLVSLAQAGKMLLTDKTPNSGTTARAAMQILAPVGASIAGGSYDAYNGDYGTAATKAALMGAAALGGPRLAQSLIANPNASNYLTQGMQNIPLRSMLLSPQEVPMVGGVLRRLPGAYDASTSQGQ